MKIYDSRYFIVNKTLMIKIGVWPYEKKVKKFFVRVFLIVSILTTSLPQLYGIVKNFGVHVDKIIEHMFITCYMYSIFSKLVTTILAEKKLSKVYENIADNWKLINAPGERLILMEYSERGRVLTIGYITYMMTTLTFFITLPLTPVLLNYVMPLNESRPPDFILHGEFPVDQYAYYTEIYIFDAFACTITVIIFITIDSTYAACIEHCLGLFAILKSRLGSCTKINAKPDSTKRRDKAFHMIVEIIKLHKKIIRLTELMESSYSMSFLLLMGMNMVCCSFVSVLLIIRRGELMELIRYTTILGGLLIHLFYVSWPGQKLIDLSGGLFEDAYTNEWYETSLKSQHLLRFMRLRCLTPCQLTAGGIYVMNFSNFATIIKTSMSYITVFASFT